jgi:hypothetical protein
MAAVTPRIFRYVVRYDAGSAPRPFGGYCTLAVCKPAIRRVAKKGDWVIGFRSRSPGEVVYVMQVAEVIPLGQYWRDRRFRDRRPGASSVPDNFCRPLAAGGLEQVANEIHGPDGAARDVRGVNALIGTRFWYFGQHSPPISTDLVHLVHSAIGHAVDKGRRPDDIEQLEHWLSAWSCGLHGTPIDASPILESQLAGLTGAGVMAPSRTVRGRCEGARRNKVGPNARRRTC